MESNAESKGRANPDIFWESTVVSKNPLRIRIDLLVSKMIDVSSRVLGYFLYEDDHGTYILVKRVRKSIIREASIQELKQDFKHLIRNEHKEEAVWAEFAKSNIIDKNFVQLLAKAPKINFHISKRFEDNHPYANGIVKVTPSSISIIPYENFEGGYVWDKQIIKRDFVLLEEDKIVSVFDKFIRNLSGNNDARYKSMGTTLGYLLHSYKDQSQSKAVILVDENITFTGAAHGGTGKTLIAKGIGKIVPMVVKDGQKYNLNETFINDDIRPYHKILYIDDVKPNFNLIDFYSQITGGIHLKRKYKDSQYLQPESTPKLLISSNYMVKGTGGDSDERRRHEVEIAPYYSLGFTPAKEFGHNFFEDWDENEWMQFDNKMMRYLQSYLQNGLEKTPSINLGENKLKLHTDPEFVIYMDGTIKLNVAYDKAVLIDGFKRLCPAQRNLSAITFKQWIDTWANARKYVATHYKSNGRAMVRFVSIEELQKVW